MITVSWNIFFRTIKNKIYYGQENKYKSFKEFKKVIKEYIDYFNNKSFNLKQNRCLILNDDKHPYFYLN